MLTKPCANPGCIGVVKARQMAELKRRKYCGHLCANRMSAKATTRAWQDQALMRACVQIQNALGVTGTPSPELIEVVRRLRRTAYQAGWAVVVGKVRRAVVRGVLVRSSQERYRA